MDCLNNYVIWKVFGMYNTYNLSESTFMFSFKRLNKRLHTHFKLNKHPKSPEHLKQPHLHITFHATKVYTLVGQPIRTFYFEHIQPRINIALILRIQYSSLISKSSGFKLNLLMSSDLVSDFALPSNLFLIGKLKAFFNVSAASFF